MKTFFVAGIIGVLFVIAIRSSIKMFRGGGCGHCDSGCGSCADKNSANKDKNL